MNEAKNKIAEFQNLAKRIVQNDLLLRKCAEKEAECNKVNNELNSKIKEIDSLTDKNRSLSKENDLFKKVDNFYIYLIV